MKIMILFILLCVGLIGCIADDQHKTLKINKAPEVCIYTNNNEIEAVLICCRNIDAITNMPLTAVAMVDVKEIDLSAINKNKLVSISILYNKFDNYIIDISELNGAKLQYLQVRNRDVENVSVINNMPLKTLILKECDVDQKDILKINSVTITNIDLENTMVRDISWLERGLRR